MRKKEADMIKETYPTDVSALVVVDLP